MTNQELTERMDEIKELVRRFEDGIDVVDNELDWNTFKQQLLQLIKEVVVGVIGEKEPVISQHYYAGDIEERTAFPDRRNNLRNKQLSKLNELLKEEKE